MNTLKASGITSEKAANEDEAAQSTKEEEKEDGNADNDDDYELPKEKTEEELAEEARTEPNAAEINIWRQRAPHAAKTYVAESIANYD